MSVVSEVMVTVDTGGDVAEVGEGVVADTTEAEEEGKHVRMNDYFTYQDSIGGTLGNGLVKLM